MDKKGGEGPLLDNLRERESTVNYEHRRELGYLAHLPELADPLDQNP